MHTRRNVTTVLQFRRCTLRATLVVGCELVSRTSASQGSRKPTNLIGTMHEWAIILMTPSRVRELLRQCWSKALNAVRKFWKERVLLNE